MRWQLDHPTPKLKTPNPNRDVSFVQVSYSTSYSYQVRTGMQQGEVRGKRHCTEKELQRLGPAQKRNCIEKELHRKGMAHKRFSMRDPKKI